MNLVPFISKLQEVETPFYFYDLALLDQTIAEVHSQISDTSYHVHYALKANANNEILARIKKAGFGADCVSGKEVERAIDSGFSPDSIVFAGVGWGWE